MAIDMASIGSIVKVASTVMQGFAQSKQADANAQEIEQEAQQAELAAADDAARLADEKRKRIGKMRTKMAVSGVALNEGSPLLAQEEQIFNFERDISRTKLNAGIRASSIRKKAATQKSQGAAAFGGGLFSAGSSFLTSGLFGGNNTKPTNTSANTSRSANLSFSHKSFAF